MSSRARASILQNFDVEVSQLIADSRGVSEMDGFRLFLDSEIHRMLEDNELKMWHFSPIAIFDMWERGFPSRTVGTGVLDCPRKQPNKTCSALSCERGLI